MVTSRIRVLKRSKTKEENQFLNFEFVITMKRKFVIYSCACTIEFGRPWMPLLNNEFTYGNESKIFRFLGYFYFWARFMHMVLIIVSAIMNECLSQQCFS